VVDALGELRGLEEEFLRQQTVETEGLVRDCVLLARGRRGDAQAKDQLRRLAQEHPPAAFRWRASEAFFKLGTPEDLPWLRAVAKRDSFYIEKWVPGLVASEDDEIPRDYYPLRERAREVIRTIERQAGSSCLPKAPPTR